MNLGTNMAFFNIEEIETLKLGRVEVCQGRSRPYAENIPNIEHTLIKANEKGIPISVHLPIYIPLDYPWDFLDAYYLDKDLEKCNYAFNFLEDNLKRLSQFNIDYFVLHFTGVYAEIEPVDVFKNRLIERLNRLNQLALKYDVNINCEYFGSNVNFYDVFDWVEVFKPYVKLGIVLDVTHYYFSSKWRGFDFMENLKYLSQHANAFHLWTTYGQGVYQQAEGYIKYHHIVPNLAQTEKDGWAFNTEEVFKVFLDADKPTIIEASPHYGGKKYYLDSIKQLRDFIK